MDARFQVCFTPLTGVLFAFPSRYWSTIGRHVVFRLGGWSPRIRAGFHVSRPTWDPSGPRPGFRLRGFHPLRPDLPVRSPSLPSAVSWSRNPEMQAPRFGLSRFRSPLLARSRLLSFPQGTEMFHFPWCSSSGTIEFIPGCHGSRHGGLPHSETSGSKPVDGSPEIIAVCRVLHRLVMPRHPSCARIRLAIWCSSPAFAPFGPDGPRSLAAGTQSPSLPYEKFLALWRGSLPADLVYELQFSFNFQLPVFKDQDDPERGRSRKQQTLVHCPP